MPAIADCQAIREFLRSDPGWSLYALGDLDPEYFGRCSWFAAPGSLGLLYRAVAPPVLFVAGPIQPLLPDLAAEPSFYLHVRPDVAAALDSLGLVSWRREMWRMILDPARFRAAPEKHTGRLSPASVAEVEALYADGVRSGESPDFFFPAMLNQVFYGIRRGGRLLAVAGTHLVSSAESVAAVGNVYTRSDSRGQGLAAACVSAVVEDLLRAGIRTVGLNVTQANQAAIRLYQRLGFATYCPFVEGLAARPASSSSA